jgi:hypothetical protein
MMSSMATLAELLLLLAHKHKRGSFLSCVCVFVQLPSERRVKTRLEGEKRVGGISTRMTYD